MKGDTGMKYTFILFLSVIALAWTTAITSCASTGSDFSPDENYDNCAHSYCSNCRDQPAGYPGCTGCESCSRERGNVEFFERDKYNSR